LKESHTTTISESKYAPKTPGGSTVNAAFGETVAIYLRAKPALAFLNTVALAGIDTKITGSGSGVLQIVSDDPGYCLTIAPSATITANGYFKGVGIKEVTTPQLSRTLATGPKTTRGLCAAPTIVDIASISPSAPIYGRPATFNISAMLDPAASFSPDSAPNGLVTVRIGDKSCDATLSPNGKTSSAGRCTLTPLRTGDAVEATLKYSGNAEYSAKFATKEISVKKATTVIAMTTSPNPSADGSLVRFSGSVLPSPTGEGDPTGNIEFKELGSEPACLAEIRSAGTGACEGRLTGIESKSFTARYSGDENFASSLSSSYSHRVETEPLVSIDPASVKCTLVRVLSAEGYTPFPRPVYQVEFSGTARVTSQEEQIVHFITDFSIAMVGDGYKWQDRRYTCSTGWGGTSFIEVGCDKSDDGPPPSNLRWTYVGTVEILKYSAGPYFKPIFARVREGFNDIGDVEVKLPLSCPTFQ
jgi:hypothetical protein